MKQWPWVRAMGVACVVAGVSFGTVRVGGQSVAPAGDGSALLTEYQRLTAEVVRQNERKEYAEAEKACRRLVALLPAMPDNYYNLACMLARQGKKEEAMAALDEAVALGFGGADDMKADEDLGGLRGTTAFDDLVKKAAQSAARRPARRSGPARIVPAAGSVAGPKTAWTKGTGPEPAQDTPVVVLALPEAARTTPLNGVSFVDGLNGWIVGARGLCLGTTDGGSTWAAQTTGSHANFRAVSFGTNGMGWICGDGDDEAHGDLPGLAHALVPKKQTPGTLLCSENGGYAWRAYWVPTNFELPCVGWDGQTAAIGTSGGNEHLDGDIFTCRLPDSGMSRVMRAVFAVVPCGGERWLAVGAPVSVRFTPPPKTSLFTERRCRVLFSNDSGKTWMPGQGSEAVGGGCLRGVAVNAVGTALAVGDRGAVLLSQDGGASWTAQVSGVNDDLLAVAWGPGKVCLAAGRKGAVLTSVDGGQTWRRLNAGTEADLRAVSVAGSRFVAVGGKGVALRLAVATETARPD